MMISFPVTMLFRDLVIKRANISTKYVASLFFNLKIGNFENSVYSNIEIALSNIGRLIVQFLHTQSNLYCIGAPHMSQQCALLNQYTLFQHCVQISSP